MKKLYKILLILIITVGATVSCEDGEGAIYTLQDNIDTSGSIIRTLSFPPSLIKLTSEENFLPITIEVQEGDGSFNPDFVEVRVYLKAYEDSDLLIPATNTNGEEFDEELLLTAPASEFELSEINGLPEYTIIYHLSLLIETFPNIVFVDPAPFFIATRLELEMTDGRVYTDSSVNSTVASGAYFSSPFLYITVFIHDADLVTTKTVDNNNPAEGDTIVYSLNVTHTQPRGAHIATNVSLIDKLPEGVTYVSDDSGGNYDVESGVWNIGDIPLGESRFMNITVTVDDGFAGETINNFLGTTENNPKGAKGDQSDPTTDGDDLSEEIIVSSGN